MTPKSEAELAAAIAAATGPLHITGGGTRPIGNPVDGASLSTASLNGITLYEPGALTLVAQAGTPVADIETALARENQRLAFEPMDHRALLDTTGTPTIGGIVAANVSGPRRVAVGACRDHMLGVRFVDGRGTVIKNGGRVMKNVTGYDLVKLMCGSYGTLGVMSEVSLKVLPRPDTSATISVAIEDDTRAVAAMSAALGSPFEVSGAAHDPASGQTHLRIEGFTGSVAYRSEKLANLLAPFGATTVTENSDTLWTAIRDVTAFAGQDGDVWRLSLKSSDAPAVVAGLSKMGALYDWGGGLIWVLTKAGHNLRAEMGDTAGHATLIRASADTRAALPVFHPENPTVTALSTGLRAKFDPRGILNAGAMG
ncbi:glycolate oxidase subunit GlcE [Octadecabacter sp. R77987]|uniref:glycolate oxidase subunit GlcE n=1 Tax=Octadecabacter sp. R77987 TaxID=3093874 RepID=UPI00366F3299